MLHFGNRELGKAAKLFRFVVHALSLFQRECVRRFDHPNRTVWSQPLLAALARKKHRAVAVTNWHLQAFVSFSPEHVHVIAANVRFHCSCHAELFLEFTIRAVEGSALDVE